MSSTLSSPTAQNIASLKRSAPEDGQCPTPPPAKKKARAKKDAKGIDLEKETKQVIRAVNSQISNRLIWKSSYKPMSKNGSLKGCRIEVPCSHEAVFGEIFGKDAAVKRKGEKLSCSLLKDDDVWDLPFMGKSYRYNAAELRAPLSASWSEHKLVVSFKFAIA